MNDLFEKLGLRPRHFWIAFAVLFVWLAIIIVSAAGLNFFPWSWNFSNTGALGDSFAPLSALMALVAALGAIGAYKVQSEEIIRIRAREKERDEIEQSDRARLISRQTEADQRVVVQAFENTFFQLLRSHKELVASLDLVAFDDAADRIIGHDVFKEILRNLKSAIGRDNKVANVRKRYSEASNYYRNDINHYFRLLYHLIRFVDISEVEEKYFYIQIVRASLSDAELAMLALNCEYGDGREKFKSLVERYALLHNLSEEEIRLWKLRRKFKKGAFERSSTRSRFEIVR